MPFFHRLISGHALLYTEMVTTGALIHGDRYRFLQFNEAERPLALQLGGSHPGDLAVCAKMAEDFGYNEVNLNVGCPSDRVQNGRFGACLMAEPELAAECIAAMQQAVSIPVTVKSRIGIDDRDSYEELAHFIATVADGGCKTFIVHARKAWLSGLSPKQNREVPPLRYDFVLSDGAHSSNTATVTLNVQAANRAPIAQNDSYTVAANKLTVDAAQGLLANDSDADNNSITAVAVTQPTNGTLLPTTATTGAMGTLTRSRGGGWMSKARASTKGRGSSAGIPMRGKTNGGG